MASYDFLYTETVALQIIENFKTQLELNCDMIGQGDHVGILDSRKGFLEYIDDVQIKYGVRITGTSLERVRNKTDLHIRWLYYDVDEGSDIDDDQNEWLYGFLDDFQTLVDGFKNRVERVETQEALEEEYRKERRSVQRKARRKGVNLKLPKIPKKITAGSVRRLQSIKAKL